MCVVRIEYFGLSRALESIYKLTGANPFLDGRLLFPGSPRVSPDFEQRHDVGVSVEVIYIYIKYEVRSRVRRKDGWYLILLPCKDAHQLNRFVPGRSEFRRRKSNYKEISLINPKPIGCAAETIQISAAWLSARWVIYSGVDVRTKYIRRRLPDFELLLSSIINSQVLLLIPSATGFNGVN